MCNSFHGDLGKVNILDNLTYMYIYVINLISIFNGRVTIKIMVHLLAMLVQVFYDLFEQAAEAVNLLFLFILFQYLIKELPS